MKNFNFILITALSVIGRLHAENHSGYSGTFYYDKNGKLSSADCMFEGQPAHINYSYENGVKTEKIYINNGQTLYWTISYDDHDNMLQKTSTMSSPDTYVYTNEYDTKGNLISQATKAYNNGVWRKEGVSSYREYLYDSSNNMIREDQYNYDQEGNTYLNVYTECSYDTPDIGNCNFKYADGRLIYPSTRNNQKTYDEYGNVIGSNGNTYVWADPEWKSKQGSSQKSEPKRIYTVEEANAAVKGNKNTFSIRYR